MDRKTHKFADGHLGDVLDELFAKGDGLDLPTNGRIARICRMLEHMRGSDSAQEMVHDDLDHLEAIEQLNEPVAALRKLMIQRRLPRGVFGNTE